VTFPEVSFVAGPSEDADVRLDLNSAFGLATCRVEHDSFTLGAPPLLGEPDSVSAALGLRSAGWVLRIAGPKSAAYDVRTLVSRELLRPTNWVRVRLSETSPPHYMQTYRGEFAALSLEFVRKGSASDTWRLPVNVTGEPLLLGERVTLGPYTVTQALDGDNPMRVVLPPIEGDGPTPLRVTVTPEDGTTANVGSKWLIGCVAGTSDMTTEATIDVAAMTAVLETGDVTADDAYFNSHYRATTFGATGLQPRLTCDFPDLPRGRYNVQLSCEADGIEDAPKTYQFRLVFLSGDGRFGTTAQLTIPGTAVATTFKGWVDLGQAPVPFGAGGLPGDVDLHATVTSVAIHMGADDGTGEVRADALRLVPVGGPTVDAATMLVSDLGAHPVDGASSATWDADAGAYWLSSYDVPLLADILTDGEASSMGGFPYASPGSDQNILHAMAVSKGRGSVETGQITAPGQQFGVSVSYHPRKLHI
jgi:hypothetical protein